MYKSWTKEYKAIYWKKWRLKNRPYKQKICVVCGEKFTQTSNYQKRCKKCQFLKCEYCGKKFVPKNKNYKQKFCSYKCATLGHPEKIERLIKNRGQKPKNRKTSICLICKKKFEHWAGKNSKYCSRECWNKRNPPILIQCLFCGKDFWDYKKQNRRYCSWKCRSLHYRELYKSKNSHLWKGGKTKLNQTLRARTKYSEWRKKIFEKDNYTCQKCGVKSGYGHKIYLHAHHIFNFADYPRLRYVVNNGITLCKKCHNEFHEKYGKHNNKKQISEFLYENKR